MSMSEHERRDEHRRNTHLQRRVKHAVLVLATPQPLHAISGQRARAVVESVQRAERRRLLLRAPPLAALLRGALLPRDELERLVDRLERRRAGQPLWEGRDGRHVFGLAADDHLLPPQEVGFGRQRHPQRLCTLLLASVHLVTLLLAHWRRLHSRTNAYACTLNSTARQHDNTALM